MVEFHVDFYARAYSCVPIVRKGLISIDIESRLIETAIEHRRNIVCNHGIAGQVFNAFLDYQLVSEVKNRARSCHIVNAARVDVEDSWHFSSGRRLRNVYSGIRESALTHCFGKTDACANAAIRLGHVAKAGDARRSGVAWTRRRRRTRGRRWRCIWSLGWRRRCVWSWSGCGRRTRCRCWSWSTGASYCNHRSIGIRRAAARITGIDVVFIGARGNCRIAIASDAYSYACDKCPQTISPFAVNLELCFIRRSIRPS